MTAVPTTARELYGLLLQTSDLCGTLTLESEGVLRWDLWEGYCLRVSLNAADCCVALETTSRFRWQVTHWHTHNEDILEELRSIGKHGSLLVIRRGWLWEAAAYFGPEAECPAKLLRKSLFSRPLLLRT